MIMITGCIIGVIFGLLMAGAHFIRMWNGKNESIKGFVFGGIIMSISLFLLFIFGGKELIHLILQYL